MTDVWTYDLGPVTRRLARKGVPHAERLEEEFRRLAALWRENPGQPLAPSPAVDAYWHEAILDTRRYREFCAGAVGRFVEHVPDDAGVGMRREYETTLRLYRARFGEPDPALWGAEGPNSMSCRDGPAG